MYTIYLSSLINSFKVAFIYYLNYAVSTKKVNGSKYNCGCQICSFRAVCLAKKPNLG